MMPELKNALKCIGCPFYDPDFGCLSDYGCDDQEVE